MEPSLSHPPAHAHEPLPARPLLVEVTRGAMVESRHRVAVAIVDAHGRVVLAAGDAQRPVYPRSAIKPLQALALIETGAADAFAVSRREIALACASHSGEPAHVEAVAAWLARIGCAPKDLECGPQLPTEHAALIALLRGGTPASALHNNCSGKHAGFLTIARHLSAQTTGYIRYEHPVQQRVLGVLESMTGLDLGDAPRGVDGCGIPVIAIPLGNVALAMARLADPHDQPAARQSACARICAAMTAEPFLVAGTGRYCTRLMQTLGDKAVVKGGAEGVYCAAIPGLGLGIALKVDDGASRAAEIAVGRVLHHLGVLGPDHAAFIEEPVRNRAGTTVGAVRGAADGPF